MKYIIWTQSEAATAPSKIFASLYEALEEAKKLLVARPKAKYYIARLENEIYYGPPPIMVDDLNGASGVAS